MNESRRRDFLKVAGGVAVVGGLAGCASEAQEGEEEPEENETTSDEETPTPEEEEEQPAEDEEEEQPPQGEGRIRVAHMIPDYPAVDVYVGDSEEPVFSNVEFTEVTDYVDLPGGNYPVRVTVADAQGLVLFDQEVSVPAGDTTAVALADQGETGGTGTTTGANFQLELFEDDNTPPQETLNDSRLRLIHAAPDAPAVDVRVGNTTIIDNLSYGEGAYADIPAGEYEFAVYPANGGAGASAGGDNGTGNLTATDGGPEVNLLQLDDEEQQDEEQDEEAQEDETQETTEEEPLFTFDAELEENSVYTAFATGYIDPEAADSDAEFQIVTVQDVVDGEVVTAEDEDE